MAANYGSKKSYRITFTPVGGSTPVNYVYKSNALDGAGVTATDLTALGIVELDPAALPTDLSAYVMKANSPKPPKVMKTDLVNGNTGTFCSPTQLNAAAAAGWAKVKNGKQQGINLLAAGKKVVTVSVTIFGFKYAWNMKTDLYTKITADLSTLGISAATANDAPDLVWGCSTPKPAKVKKVVAATGGGFDTYTTFCGQTNEDSLPAGWSIVEPRIAFTL